MTARLALFYLVSTLLILLCITGFQLLALIEDLEFEDNDFLVERITSIRSIIAHRPDSLSAIEDTLQLDHTTQGTRYLVRILDAHGNSLLESPGIAALASQAFPPPVPGGEEIGKGAKYSIGDEKHYLLNAAWAEGVGEHKLKLVQVALDTTDDVDLIAKYRLKMGISLFAGLCLATGFGIIITRKGLQPLNQMAAKVEKITSTDLHQRVRSEVWPKELDQLTVAIDGMLGRLEGSFDRLQEFSANLAHELRTPINNLRGEAEVTLSLPRTADEYRHTIESSMEEYERLSRMVSDILFLARPEKGIELNEIDARAEIETLADYYRYLEDEKRISLTIHGAGSLQADPRLFQRAIGNLISNAIQYSPTGGQILIDITTKEDDTLIISIKDNGIGIPPEELDRVFYRFYRSAAARKYHHQGSGLGLAIVKSIMDLHGGSVHLESEPGKGTTASLVFPLNHPPRNVMTKLSSSCHPPDMH